MRCPKCEQDRKVREAIDATFDELSNMSDAEFRALFDEFQQESPADPAFRHPHDGTGYIEGEEK